MQQDFTKRTTPVATKQHICSVCGGAIEIGEKHIFVRSVRNGEHSKQRIHTKCDRRKMIYISQPFGGRPENHAKAEQIALRLQQEYPQYTFISPVVAFGYAYNAFDYETGINICLDLLSRCDEIWICYDNGESRGVKIERNWAREHGMIIREEAA
jgi:hypothetical protein